MPRPLEAPRSMASILSFFISFFLSYVYSRRGFFVVWMRRRRFCRMGNALATEGTFFKRLCFSCTFFFEKKARKKAIRDMLVCEASQAGLAEMGKEPRSPLKSSRRKLSAPSALPKQRRKCSSNLKMFFDCAGLLCLRGRDKVRAFCPIFSEYKSKRSGNPLL